jgi:agmatine deiminase
MKQYSQCETPFSLRFRMPAEWEPHEATWLGWPHEVTDWPGKFAVIPWAFSEIVRHLSRVERVFLLVESRGAQARVRSMLKKSGANLDAVDFYVIPTNRGWMRDSGPICVRNESSEVAFNNFRFNGWAKYPNHKKDAAIVSTANKKLKRHLWQPQHKGRGVVIEGGSIDVNGCDPPAFFKNPRHGSLANAAGAAGNNYALVFESSHVIFLFSTTS